MSKLVDELFNSALQSEGLFSELRILSWVKSRMSQNQYSVNVVPLENLVGWQFDSVTGNLGHSSGKFFLIEGLNVKIKTDDTTQCWQQPIVNQPEIGILGFLAKKIDGTMHLLVQAKMEPGNINFTQISPTVQATRSNYRQAHGGQRPEYIEYFLDIKVGRILLDQLQSEQGTRYLNKRNRNMVLQLPDDYPLSHSEEYMWITVGQLQKLMRFSNLVHLDCRSILGSVVYRPNIWQSESYTERPLNSFSAQVGSSVIAADEQAEHDMPSVLSWLTRVRCEIEVDATTIPLNQVANWSLIGGKIKHVSNRFFSVIGVEVTASNREVKGWCQPLICSIDGGIIGLLAQIRNGILHFLIQARAEPAVIDMVELAPTVQCTPENYQNVTNFDMPSFISIFQSATSQQIRFDSMLSDEGGRFYRSQQRHLVVELNENLTVELPVNYCWMTLKQIQSFAQYGCNLNIELRSIISCLAVID